MFSEREDLVIERIKQLLRLHFSTGTLRQELHFYRPILPF